MLQIFISYDYNFRLGESCSHICAILYKIEAAVRLGYTKQACTDIPCKWNNDFVKRGEGARIKDIMFYKQTKSIPVKRTFEAASEMEQNIFLNDVAKIPERDYPVGMSLFCRFSNSFHHKAAIPKTVKSLLKSC